MIGAPILLRKLFRGKMKFGKIGVLLLVGAGIWFFLQNPNLSKLIPGLGSPQVEEAGTNPASVDQSDIRSLYDSQRSGVMVTTEGQVTRILKDDNKGSRHQRFLIEIPGGLTLLVAHNIDLAPRVPLAEHDHVLVYGQYEWTNKGGVLHWTHHDPNKRHEEGWIDHQGKRYE